MKSAQARASVETLREVQNDKALKTKAEKERRLRQANSVMKKLRVWDRGKESSVNDWTRIS